MYGEQVARSRLENSTPQAPKVPIAPIFKAASVTLAVSREKDGKLRLVYAGWDERLLCWTSHERASALRSETVHCRSLISHSRRAVSVSCASAAFAPGQRSMPRSRSQRAGRWQAIQGFLLPSPGYVPPALPPPSPPPSPRPSSHFILLPP